MDFRDAVERLRDTRPAVFQLSFQFRICIPSGTVNLDIFAAGDAGLPYQIGTSLGKGPIPIDTRQLGLSPDPLLFLSVGGLAPTVFQNYAGILDASGKGQGKINIPNDPVLVGINLYNAFVTLKVGEPSNIKSISPTVLVVITR